jgi:hypothetical protein
MAVPGGELSSSLRIDVAALSYSARRDSRTMTPIHLTDQEATCLTRQVAGRSSNIRGPPGCGAFKLVSDGGGLGAPAPARLYRELMTSLILEAIETAVPGITQSTRYQSPTWMAPLEQATDVWLGGMNIRHVEVTPEWNSESNIGRLIVNALTDEGLIAQTSITVGRETTQGTFSGWKIVRLRTITTLTWEEHNLGARKAPQVTATFEHLTEPVRIPGEIERTVDIEVVTEIFRTLRASWIDSGSSESAHALS